MPWDTSFVEEVVDDFDEILDDSEGVFGKFRRCITGVVLPETDGLRVFSAVVDVLLNALGVGV